MTLRFRHKYKDNAIISRKRIGDFVIWGTELESLVIYSRPGAPPEESLHVLVDVPLDCFVREHLTNDHMLKLWESGNWEVLKKVYVMK